MEWISNLQFPACWNIPGSSDLLVNNWVIVLEVGTKSFGLKSSPNGELSHGIRLSGPVWELVSVEWELLLEVSDGRTVLKEQDLVPISKWGDVTRYGGRLGGKWREITLASDEWKGWRTYGSVAGLEAIDLLLWGSESFTGYDGLQDLLDELDQNVSECLQWGLNREQIAWCCLFAFEICEERYWRYLPPKPSTTKHREPR